MFSLIPWRREGAGRLAPRTEHPLNLFRHEMEEWFERLLGRWPTLFEEGMEIEETDKAMVVRTDAPGFEPADFTIEVRENVLTITAERKVEAEGKPPTVVRRLRRVVTLPVPVEPEKMEARYHSGVLEVTMPRAEPVKARKVEVKAV
jgi:HSP20 family protein